MYIYIKIYVYICKYMFNVCIYVYICMYIYIKIYVYICKYMFNVCMYVYLLYLYDIYTEERLFLNILAATAMYLSTLFFQS